MKALSFIEPWATLVAIGVKRIETRSWRTFYRGPLLICASLKIDPIAAYELRDLYVGHQIQPGFALAHCELLGVEQITERFSPPCPTELRCGDYRELRYAWRLGRVHRIHPLPVKGQLQIFEVPDDGIRLLNDSSDAGEEAAELAHREPRWNPPGPLSGSQKTLDRLEQKWKDKVRRAERR